MHFTRQNAKRDIRQRARPFIVLVRVFDSEKWFQLFNPTGFAILLHGPARRGPVLCVCRQCLIRFHFPIQSPAYCLPPDKRASASNALTNRPEPIVYIPRASGWRPDSPVAANWPSPAVFAPLPAAGPINRRQQMFWHPGHFRQAVTHQPNPHGPSPIAAEAQVPLRTPAPPRPYDPPIEALLEALCQ